MNKSHYLAVDLGATSGRTILASFNGTGVSMKEITRFANPMIPLGGHLYWDIAGLYNEPDLKGIADLKLKQFISFFEKIPTIYIIT